MRRPKLHGGRRGRKQRCECSAGPSDNNGTSMGRMSCRCEPRHPTMLERKVNAQGVMPKLGMMHTKLCAGFARVRCPTSDTCETPTPIGLVLATIASTSSTTCVCKPVSNVLLCFS